MNIKMIKAAFAGLVLTVSGFANAGLMNVSYIEITNAKGEYLQVAEVIANDMFNNDMALTGLATASAPHQWSGISGAEKAIDGITLGNYNLGQIFHEKYLNSTLTITFNSVQDISSIQIFGRTDCCTSRDIYNVSLFGKDRALLQTLSNVAPGAATATRATAVPEPSTIAILALGIMGLASRRFKK